MEKQEAIGFNNAPVPEYGELIYAREFPGEVSLIPAVVVRLVACLEKENLVDDVGKVKLNLCFDEALKNAILHGNKSDASLSVSIKVYTAPEDYWVVISDQGEGFTLESIPDPLADIGLFRESGRGIYLMDHYTDSLEYWDGGKTVALCFARKNGEKAEV